LRSTQITHRLVLQGPLRIVEPKSSFVPILMPLLAEFCRKHAGMRPDIQLEDRIGNWVQDSVDVGFRIGASPGEGVSRCRARRTAALNTQSLVM
jgi:DNA-binding transcriptional LysR family regulator